jgi:Bacterial archaeo-eukaryotic release factor family 3
MDAIERDYKTVLLASHEPPCLSLYQPTHRSYPEKRQDLIRFRNLVRELELALRQKYATRESTPILRPFHELVENDAFWIHALDGLAMFAAPGVFKVYRLQRPVRELTIVADSFHTKPLMRILQSMDCYHVLGLNRHEARLFEGNRYALDEIELPSGFPRAVSDVVGDKEGEPERKSRVYGPAGPGKTTRHSTAVRQEETNSERERFFRAVDGAVLERFSSPSGMPLLLAALPEHHHLFRTVSRNPFLMTKAVDTDPSALSINELRARAWQLVLPVYLDRLRGLIDRFNAAKTAERGSHDLAEIGRAAAAGRISILLIEADRVIPGHFDPVSGSIQFAEFRDPMVDDILDDLGEHALKTGGEVVVVPAERMPTVTGIAAIYRY